MLTTSEHIGDIAEALSKAQAEIKNPTKDTHVEEGDYKTAPFNKFIDAVKKPFRKYGLSFAQGITTSEKEVSVTTRLMHNSGEWIQGEAVILQFKPEERGLALYTAKKDSFCGLIGITGENEAEGTLTKQKKDYNNHFETPAQRRQAKQDMIDDLKHVTTAEELEEFEKMHGDNIEKLTAEDPDYVSDVVRDITVLRKTFKNEKDDIKGKV
jgi:hypothetical protein